MPIPIALAAAALTSGAQIGGNALSNRANRRNARDQANWNLRNQQNQQTFDLDMWNRANQYNSPSSQMQRFKDAGLSPQLMYGKGSNGNAAPLKAPNVQSYTRADHKSIATGVDTFGDYARFQNLQAQTDNVKASTNTQQQKALLTAQQTLNESLKHDTNSQLQATSIDAAKVNLQKQIHETTKAGNDAFISNSTKKTQVSRIKQELANAVKSGNNKDLDAAIKRFEVKLNKLGLSKTDSRIYRWLGTLIDKVPQSYKDRLLKELTPNPLLR